MEPASPANWRSCIRRHRAALAGLTLLAVPFLWPAFNGGWILDDLPQVSQNPRLESWGSAGYLLTHGVWQSTAGQEGGDIYRPTMMLSFLALRRLFGPQPAAFHFWNLLLHLANAGLLYLWGWRLLRSRGAAFGAAALFLLHPLAVESWAWVGGLQDLYCLGFFLAAILVLPAEPRKRLQLWLVPFFLLLSLLSKETALAFLPLALAAMLRPHWLGLQAVALKWWRAWSLLLLPAAIYLALRGQALGAIRLTADLGWTERGLAWGKSLALFWRLFFFPGAMKFHRPFTLEGEGGRLALLGAALLLAALLLPAFYRAHREGKWILGCLGALLAAPLFPAAAAAQLTGIMAERYFYPALPGALLAIFWAAGRWKLAPASWGRRAGVAMIAALLSASGLAAFRYAGQWNDEGCLLAHAAAHPPVSYEVYYDLGYSQVRNGRLEQAEMNFRRALQLRPDYPRALNNLGVVLMRQGRFGEALPLLDRLLRQSGDSARYLYNRGQVLYGLGRYAEARDSFRRCLTLEPSYPQARQWLWQSQQVSGRQSAVKR